MKLKEYVDKNFDRFVSDLQSLCRMPSVAGRDDMELVAEAVAEQLRHVGASTEIVKLPGGAPPVVIGEIGSGKPVMMVYDHYDVQPPEPLEEWSCDPYEAVIRDGKLIARGVSDNKGNLMARIQAVEALQKTGELPGKVLFVVEGEEEIGSPSLPGFVRDHKERLAADGCMWEAGDVDDQGRLVLYLGGKGICYVELTVTADRSDVHSSMAAVVVNPAWRLNWALSTIKDRDENILIDGFYDQIRPISERAQEMAKVLDIDTGMKEELLLFHNREDIARRLIFEPTATICGLYSGYDGPGSKTVLPAKAGAKIDFRLVPDQDPDQIEQLLRQHLIRHGFSDIQVTPHGHLAPAMTDPDAVVVKSAIAAAAEVYGKEPVVVPAMPGSGPLSLFINELGIPTVSFGVGYRNSQAHAPDENIRLEDYRSGIVMAARLLEEFAASLQ